MKKEEIKKLEEENKCLRNELEKYRKRECEAVSRDVEEDNRTILMECKQMLRKLIFDNQIKKLNQSLKENIDKKNNLEKEIEYIKSDIQSEEQRFWNGK